MTRHTGEVVKGWGSELIWATNDHYCGKLLRFDTNSRFSMHFHAHKDETWYVLSGRFQLHWIDTETAVRHSKELGAGDVWHNSPLQPHQLVCLEQGQVIEVSTADSVEDNYRIEPGDSQT